MDKLPIKKMNLDILTNFKTELKTELDAILNWWMTYTIDVKNGGFYGKVNNKNIAIPNSPKGLVLNARILYTFSSAYALNNNNNYLSTANRAFNYIIENFADPLNGGFYWSVSEKGKMLDGKKQVYGQAFVIYAFAEYYKITKDKQALTFAKNTFILLEKNSFDTLNLGYTEALTRDWQAIDDLRLSEKDQNEKKSMNTHLHVIEAYANLYAVWPNDELKLAIKNLLANFNNHIIDKETYHLKLFFTETWAVKSSLISFGHDIEAAWLLQEAAEIINEKKEILTFKQIALKMSNATRSGLDKNGGLWYEYDTITKHWIKELHWWSQAEAMVGFFNAWQIDANEEHLLHSIQSWKFIKNHIKDDENGEWFWGINSNYTLLQNQNKAGFWKCPYHNGRACIELIKRISML
jgi:mannobiose 2-epimerase